MPINNNVSTMSLNYSVKLNSDTVSSINNIKSTNTNETRANPSDINNGLNTEEIEQFDIVNLSYSNNNIAKLYESKENNISQRIKEITKNKRRGYGYMLKCPEKRSFLLGRLMRYRIYVDENDILLYEKINDNNYKIYLSNGLIITMTEQGDISSVIDVDSEKKYNVSQETNHKGELQSASIFDIDNAYTQQYGGNQTYFRDNVEDLLEDPLILSRLREIYPNASMEEYELYLKNISGHGCPYVACVNTIFVEYEGREEEFKRKFGFPMYTIDDDGNINYNYEYIILDFFNYLWGNNGDPIEDVYKNGGKGDNDFTQFDEFLREKYHINIRNNERYKFNAEQVKLKVGSKEYDELYYSLNDKIDMEYGEDLYYKGYSNETVIREYQRYIQSGYQVIICSNGYNLYNMDGTIACENGGGHAMYVTGVSEDNKLIVSSWGKQYIIDVDVVDKDNGFVYFQTIKY